MLIEMRHSGIVTRDLEESLEFYTNVLGMHEVARGTLSQYDTLKFLGVVDCELQYVKLGTQSGQTLVEIYYFMDQKFREFQEQQEEEDYYERYDFHHMAFTVDNVQKVFDKLVELEYETICSPSIDEQCKHSLFFAYDPDGNLIEFVEVL